MLAKPVPLPISGSLMRPEEGPAPGGEDLDPLVWAWSEPEARAALRSRDLGAILRAFRRAHGLTQEQLAGRLGYDRTYVSMIESGRRRINDVPTRRHLAATLAVPAHLLGVTDPADSDHVTMLAFAESTIRLADLARGAGHATSAVNELWPLVTQLEARVAEGHLEGDTLAVLGRAWTSLGTSLGTVLPEERLTVAARWTHKGVAAAEQLDDPRTLAQALALHGNELRKSGQAQHSIAILERAAAIAPRDQDAGGAMAFLARATAELGHRARFNASIDRCHRLIDDHGPIAFLAPATVHEIHLRGLLDLGDLPAAVTLDGTAPAPAFPTPQWDTIASITSAYLSMAIGEFDRAHHLLVSTIPQAAAQRLPHQIQRIRRIAQRDHQHDLRLLADEALANVCSRPTTQA